MTMKFSMDKCKQLLRGVSFVLLWYIGIIWAVVFVYTPFLLLLFINRKWYRKVTDIILSVWEMYPASLLEIFMGSRICITGDHINPDESSIIIMNHRNRLDWFFLWAALLHSSKPPAHRCKFVLKSDVRWIPGIGWGLQMAGFLFIHRNWQKDQVLLQRSLDYFKDLEENYQILIFPEGTNLSSSTKEKSHLYAAKNGLPKYDCVLHPRTTGFSFLVKHMQKNSQLHAIYDLTVGYPKTLPVNETDILKGKIPEEVHFHIKRYGNEVLPKDEEKIKTWCEDRWAEKEKMLNDFYSAAPEKRKMVDGEKIRCDRPWNALYLALVSWTVVTVITLYLTFYTVWGFYWAVITITGFVSVSGLTYGIQNFEIDLFRKYDHPCHSPNTNTANLKPEKTNGVGGTLNYANGKHKRY